MRSRAAVGHLVALVAAVVTSLSAPAGSAWAHGTESDQAAVLVEQALALIANEAGADRVAERIHDAAEAPDQMGVDAAKVKSALELTERPDAGAAELAQARGLLLDAVGGQLPSRPTAGPAVGTETGTSVILDEFRPGRGIRNGGDVALLVISVAVLGVGLFLVRRWRPPHTIRQLEHRGARRAG
ncbi:hypothetical protein [Kitasatospora cathayae]|uniref:Uncharacterized protein n=1 Tax=Kitasatospora cathayae TaxID=3004092 RepID=A0ABY7PXE0_9ACTN|nr:hypothetical protein [Kitasatospora sp. HUAS 3-15]WBP85105.1 hypothetical protein O1G21_04060 [Kitasatospora sp. HUAS 3-15]